MTASRVGCGRARTGAVAGAASATSAPADGRGATGAGAGEAGAAPFATTTGACGPRDPATRLLTVTRRGPGTRRAGAIDGPFSPGAGGWAAGAVAAAGAGTAGAVAEAAGTR